MFNKHQVHHPLDIEETFLRHMTEGKDDECWNYDCTRPDGYGQFLWDGHRYRAHRYAWMRVNGYIPDGMVIMHTCDNPPCVNPAHLRCGTQQDNVADRDAKGRHRTYTRNETHYAARTVLTPEQVAEVRSKHAAGGVTQIALAREYGCSRFNIFDIVHARRRV